MNKTNMALLGFVSSAADYLKDKLTEESEEIKEIADIDLETLKKELSERLGSAFEVEENSAEDLIKAGREAFEDILRDSEKTSLMSEFDDIFNVDFGNRDRDEKIQSRLLELLLEPEKTEETPEFNIIAEAARKKEEVPAQEKEITGIPGDSKEIDDIFSEILDSENKPEEVPFEVPEEPVIEDIKEPVEETPVEEAANETARETEDLAEFEDEPENFEEKLEAERQIEKEIDMRPLSERLRSVGNSDVNEDFSEEEMDRLFNEIDLSEIRKERENELKEDDQNKTLSSILRDAKKRESTGEAPYTGEPEFDINSIDDSPRDRGHRTLSDILRDIREGRVETEPEPVIEEIPEEVPVEETVTEEAPVIEEPVIEETVEDIHDEMIEEAANELIEGMKESNEPVAEFEEIEIEETPVLVDVESAINEVFEKIEEETKEEVPAAEEPEEKTETEEPVNIDSLVFGPAYDPEEETLTDIETEPESSIYFRNPGAGIETAEFEETDDFENKAEELAEQIRKDIEESDTVIERPADPDEIVEILKSYVDTEGLTVNERPEIEGPEAEEITEGTGPDEEVFIEVETPSEKTDEVTSEIENVVGEVEETFDRLLESENVTGQDFLGELINGLSTDAIARRIEEARIKEEKTKNVIYESIKAIYPYLSDGFIRGVYDLKGSLAYDYPEDEDIIILHRLRFNDVDGLRNFVEVILSHDYAVNVDELQMIVDVFKAHVNTDGRILTDIFEVANQAKLLGGDYEGYKIIEENEVDF